MGRPKVRRRSASGDDRHWLGEGLAGQEVLLLDLDPYLAATSADLNKEISRRRREQDFSTYPSLLWLPEVALCPFISPLAKLGPVTLLTEEPDGVVSSAASEFGLNVITDISEAQNQYYFIFCLEQVWSSAQEYAMHVRNCLTMLQEGGVIVCLLRAVRKNEETLIYWNEDSFTSLDRLITQGVFPLKGANLAQAVSLGEYFSTPSKSIKEQQKIFREFYGKGIEASYLKRLSEPDLSGLLSYDNFSVLLYYEV